jgi:hypothetical protein
MLKCMQSHVCGNRQTMPFTSSCEAMPPTTCGSAYVLSAPIELGDHFGLGRICTELA